jgi:predicted PolB exonuclease-like 3'-5' exonuclease
MNYIRNFSGATWVKNLCFDNTGEKNWQFSNNFIDKLVSWHGNEFNWGVKYYRGKSIILWDTLRDFQLN